MRATTVIVSEGDERLTCFVALPPDSYLSALPAEAVGSLVTAAKRPKVMGFAFELRKLKGKKPGNRYQSYGRKNYDQTRYP